MNDYLIAQFKAQFPKDTQNYTHFIFEDDNLILDINTDESKKIYERLLTFKSFFNKAAITISTELFVGYKNINKGTVSNG
jgi:hypothetical protein